MTVSLLAFPFSLSTFFPTLLLRVPPSFLSFQTKKLQNFHIVHSISGPRIRDGFWEESNRQDSDQDSFSKDCKKKAHNLEAENGTQVTRVLFCGPHWPYCEIYTREYLQDYPFIQVVDVCHDDVPAVIGKYHICVVKNGRLDSEIIARAKKMKLILQFGVGLEGVDIDAATRNGIKVARVPGSVTGNAASSAEMAIYLMLGLLRKQKEMEIAVKQKRLGEPVGETLLGKREVFILGFGNIGVELAKRLRPFGVRILAIKRHWDSKLFESGHPHGYSIPVSHIEIDGNGINALVDRKGGPENLLDFASEADIVVTCLPLNSETVGIVNEKFLSSMKKGSFLFNVGRGGLLDYDSVLCQLKLGHLGGLGLDVAWTEPFDPNDPILKLPNVLLTPHVAGVTEKSWRTTAQVVSECILQLHSGAPLTRLESVN